MAEKRREHRLKANIPIKIVYGNNQELVTLTHNLSRLGTYLETDRQIPAGQDVDVCLELPAYSADLSLAGEIRCQGSVFRSHPVRQSPAGQYWGEGIFFTEFSGQGKEKLSRYIDYLIEKEEQMVKDGVRRRKEKEESGQEYDFQKEVLTHLKDISRQLEEIMRQLQPPGKK